MLQEQHLSPGVKAGMEWHLGQELKVVLGSPPVDLAQCWVGIEFPLEVEGRASCPEVNL